MVVIKDTIFKRSSSFAGIGFDVGTRNMQTISAGDFSSGVVGLKALDDLLTRLPPKIQKEIMRKAMRQALKPFYKAARQNVPVGWQRYEIWDDASTDFMNIVYNMQTRRKTGRLRKSIVNKSRSNKFAKTFNGNVFVVHKKHRAYYAHLTEFGTQGHYINNWFGHQGFQKWVKGQKAQKWMTKAWQKKWKQSLRNFQRIMKAEVKRQFRKYLIDLSKSERRMLTSKVIR